MVFDNMLRGLINSRRAEGDVVEVKTENSLSRMRFSTKAHPFHAFLVFGHLGLSYVLLKAVTFEERYK